MTSIFVNENAASVMNGVKKGKHETALLGSKNTNSRRKVLGQVDPNIHGSEKNSDGSLTKKTTKRKQITKKSSTEQEKPSERISRQCSEPTDTSSKSSTANTESISSPSELNTTNSFPGPLQSAEPVLDPDDSLEYENELRMLQEFYQRRCDGDYAICPFDQQEGIEENSLIESDSPTKIETCSEDNVFDSSVEEESTKENQTTEQGDSSEANES